ncbi:hypothetical protein [Massilia sp. H6]|uniref:hypothetical protein n=1 Tax=Massilia sp. H6 TaxID=2970464 RepID=UPI0021672DD9|nr:hypothetical protein [Massilia sp. H6]UVW28194.1 hypothetical protein NRS07_16945 [Massilia sp. H6]
MKRFTLAAALAISLSGAAQAAVIDISAHIATAAPPRQPLPNLSVTPRQDIVTPPTHLSELPEPEVFAMMLLGLILIGVKARRDRSEKFK